MPNLLGSKHVRPLGSMAHIWQPQAQSQIQEEVRTTRWLLTVYLSCLIFLSLLFLSTVWGHTKFIFLVNIHGMTISIKSPFLTSYWRFIHFYISEQIVVYFDYSIDWHKWDDYVNRPCMMYIWNTCRTISTHLNYKSITHKSHDIITHGWNQCDDRWMETMMIF